MDDEESVRKILQGILEKLGYTVVAASEGKQAVELFKQARTEKQPFDLVILDLTIHGGMGGKEAIKTMRKIDPGIKALVASGYSTDPVLSKYLSYGFDGVLIKPFRLKELGEALQKVFLKTRS
jgi:CheY-like chemotaxis protein